MPPTRGRVRKDHRQICPCSIEGCPNTCKEPSTRCRSCGYKFKVKTKGAGIPAGLCSCGRMRSANSVRCRECVSKDPKLRNGVPKRKYPMEPFEINFGVVNIRVYKNYRGEIAVRKFIPLRLRFGESEYHTGKQYFLEVYDVEKEDLRTYALSGFIC